MIRINLLTVERERTKKRSSGGGLAFGPAQKMTLACGLLLVGSVGYIAWRYLSLTTESSRVDREIAQSQDEAGRLHGIVLIVLGERLQILAEQRLRVERFLHDKHLRFVRL